MQELFIFQQHIRFDSAATMARVQNLEGLLPMQEGRLLAHDTLVGEANWQSMVLNIIILAGGNVLPLVRPPRTHCHLTHVTRRTKTHTVQRLTVKSHGQLIHDRIHVVRHKFRPARSRFARRQKVRDTIGQIPHVQYSEVAQRNERFLFSANSAWHHMVSISIFQADRQSGSPVCDDTPVSHAPGVLCHCGQRNLVFIELLVASLRPEHSHVGLAVGRLVARLLVWMGHREDLSIAAHDLCA